MKKHFIIVVLVSLVIGAGSAALFSYLYFTRWEFLERIEYRLKDYRFLVRGSISTDPAVVYCNIDDAALSEFGQYPIPRNYYTRAIKNLAAAKMVGFDVMFFEESVVRQDATAAVQNKLDQFITALQEGINAEGKLNPATFTTLEKYHSEIVDSLQSPDEKLAEAATLYGRALFPLIFSKVYNDEAARLASNVRLDAIASHIQNLFFRQPKLYDTWFNVSPFQAISEIETIVADDESQAKGISLELLEKESLSIITKVEAIDSDFVLSRLEQEKVIISREELNRDGLDYWYVLYRVLLHQQGQPVDPPISPIELETGKFILSAPSVYEEKKEQFEKMAIRMGPYRAAHQKVFAKAFGGLAYNVQRKDVWQFLLGQKSGLNKEQFRAAEVYVRNAILKEKSVNLEEILLDEFGNPPRDPEHAADIARAIRVADGQYNETTVPLVPLSLATSEPVYITVENDFDGSLRSYPVVIRRGSQAYFAMGFVMACTHLNVALKDVRIQPGKFVHLPNATTSDGRKQTIRIPIDKHGSMLINWAGKFQNNQLFKHYRYTRIAKEIADDQNSQKEEKSYLNELKDKLVLIGLTATGTHDFAPIPFDGHYPLVGAHANVINTILTQNFLSPDIGLSRVKNMAVICGLALVIALTTATYPQLWSGVAFLLVSASYLCFVQYAFVQWGQSFNIIYSFFAMSIPFAGVLLFRYMTEERQKKVVKGMFSTMVSEDVLHYMQEDPDRFKLTGEKKMATMFFSDVVGFTTISEKLTAEDLAQVLNDYLTPMSDIIMEYGGYIDKYEGDAIMADYGVPIWDDLDDPDSHAWKSCWAALDQRKELLNVSRRIQEKYGVGIDVRMGINTGEVSAGNMGSTQKFQYTVMGDAVNQAARFEPANKSFGTYIMIGEPTVELAKEKIEVRFLTSMIVKGKTEPVRAYELLAKKGELSAEKNEVVRLFEHGWDLHAEKKFEEALKTFDKCLRLDPDDGPSHTYREICLAYLRTPPADDWKGEWIQTSK